MATEKRSILCVDDNLDNLELMAYIFEQEGFEVKTCDSIENCLPLVYENTYAAIILDNWFKGEARLEVCRGIRAFDPEVPIVFYSAEARTDEIEKALSAGA